MRTLYLSLKKQWYEMIERGEKREEYREMKPYWQKRLIETSKTYPQSPVSCDSLKRIDAVCLSYGYTKRRMTFECAGITIGRGRPEWGAPEDEVFVIKLGRRIS